MPDELELLFEEIASGSLRSRREFFRRLGASGLALGGASAFLAACGGIKGEAHKTKAATAAVNHPKTAITELDFSNWPLYIDKKTIPDFQKRYGGHVKYTQEINDNEEFFGKIRQPLAQGQSIGRDIMVLTDWMAARCVRLGFLEPLDKRNIPNAKNLTPNLQHPKWDPNRAYSLPWQSGMTIIGYNKTKVPKKPTSIKDLFDPAYKGRVSLLSDPRDAGNFILLKNGIKPEDATINDVLNAISEIDKINKSGQIRRFTGNDYSQDLTKGNLWLAQVYSGDVIQLQADNPHLDYVIPEEGATLWTDNMLMPLKAPHPYAAETMMNFVYDPQIAAQIAAYVNYVSPVQGAKEVLLEQDPKTANNPLIFPPPSVQAKLHPFPNLNEDEERRMNEAFQAVIGA
jgi:spermidine/putrescine transport system substrate-binding protein